MILIVTPNPLLERRFTYEQVKPGTVNKGAVTKISAGGKGINVSRQLKKLGVKSYNYFLLLFHYEKKYTLCTSLINYAIFILLCAK